MSSIDQEISGLIDQLAAVKANLEDYKAEKTLRYQRSSNNWKGYKSYTIWRVLLDESKTKWCVRDANGFRSVDKKINDQIVIAPEGVKTLLLAKSTKDKELGRTILSQIAEKKYGPEE
jgi:hypothetical protein